MNATIKEQPFELLRKKDGTKFLVDTIKNWYIARSYVLKLLAKKENEYLFSPESKERLHIVLPSDDNRMLFIARHVALYAHYANFNEECEDEASSCKTRISIITDDVNIKQKLSQEQFLCNLPNYCRYVVEHNVEGVIEQKIENHNSYIDIELNIVSYKPAKGKNDILIEISQEDVDNYFEQVSKDNEDIFTIDTRKAFYTGKMYNIGEAIDNLPAENIHNTKRYAMALNVYQYARLSEKPQKLFDKKIKEGEQYKLRELLSNVFCSDCFKSRAQAIMRLNSGNLKNDTGLWARYNEALSKSEHSRWVVEKLIMGFRPFNEEEHHQYEVLRAQFRCNDKLKKFHDNLKRNDQVLAHLDICSYRDLRRINPHDLKYDSFLMLAIPKILDKVGENL